MLQLNSKLMRACAKWSPLLLGTQSKNHLTILIYHRVLPIPDVLFPNEVTLEGFDWQMELLARYFNPLSMSEALQLMDNEQLPERSVCVTFDDGYADNESVALPILQKWKVPATVFVASGFLNGGRMWNDTVKESIRRAKGRQLDLRSLELGRVSLDTVVSQQHAIERIIGKIKYWAPERRELAVTMLKEQVSQPLPDDLMMSNEQVLNLHRHGITIGSHTVNHPILAGLNRDELILEVEKNKQDLQKIIGKSIRYFAYPNGKPGIDYLARQRDIIRELDFDAAVSTHWGAVSSQSDRWQLPRFTPWDKTPIRFMMRLLQNYRNSQ